MNTPPSTPPAQQSKAEAREHSLHPAQGYFRTPMLAVLLAASVIASNALPEARADEPKPEEPNASEKPDGELSASDRKALLERLKENLQNQQQLNEERRKRREEMMKSGTPEPKAQVLQQNIHRALHERLGMKLMELVGVLDDLASVENWSQERRAEVVTRIRALQAVINAYESVPPGDTTPPQPQEQPKQDAQVPVQRTGGQLPKPPAESKPKTSAPASQPSEHQTLSDTPPTNPTELLKWLKAKGEENERRLTELTRKP